MVINMLQKTCRKNLCLFYILILFFWSAVSATTAASEMTDFFGSPDFASSECDANHSSVALTPMGRSFPSQEYLSARDFGVQESVSTARGRSARPLPRSVRNADVLFPDSLFSGAFLSFAHFSEYKIPSYRFCNIMITNYIHDQDGHKI